MASSSRPSQPIRLLLLCLLALSCGEAGGDEDQAARRRALEQQRAQLRDQFAVAQNQVRNTQAQALEHPEVVPLRERFYAVLRERMVELDPRAERWLDEARELGGRIDALSQPEVVLPGQVAPDPDSVRRDRVSALEEFAELEQELRPLQARAMGDPQVAAAFEAFQDTTHAVMVRINPGAETSLARMRRTSAAIDSLNAILATFPE